MQKESKKWVTKARTHNWLLTTLKLKTKFLHPPGLADDSSQMKEVTEWLILMMLNIQDQKNQNMKL